MSGGEWTQDPTGLNIPASEAGKGLDLKGLMGLYGITQGMTGKATPQLPQMMQAPTLQPPASMMEILKKYGR